MFKSFVIRVVQKHLVPFIRKVALEAIMSLKGLLTPEQEAQARAECDKCAKDSQTDLKAIEQTEKEAI
ncbi:MAG: hypothetical protein FWE37_02655 [Spirochaetaceae bacterium]|nr:hypothetical protein [Spirochaetaceae bacterium]